MKIFSTLLLFTLAFISLWSCKPKGSPYIIDVDPVPTDSSTIYAPEELEALCSIFNRHDPLGLYESDTSEPYQALAKALLHRLDSNLSESQIQSLVSIELGKRGMRKTTDMTLHAFSKDVSTLLKTGSYVNEKGQMHININHFYIDESEINSHEYKPFVPDTSNLYK